MLPLPARNWPIPPMDHEAGDKLSAFSWAMGRLILQRIGDGETIKAITADARMPAYATVYRWVEVHEEFGAAYRQLRAMMARVKREDRDARQKPRRPSGRKTTYTWDRGSGVCEAIELGASLSDVVRRPGMPSFKAIYRWLRYEPAFRAEYIEACAIRELRLLETTRDIALAATPATVKRDARRIHWLRGRIGRLTPRLYREG
jgi:hypothetical protein